MKKQVFIFYPFLLVLLLLLFAGGLVYGAVSIPVESVVNILLGEGTERLAWQNIVLQSRFPQAVTALLARAYQYAGRYQEAYECAKEVLEFKVKSNYGNELAFDKDDCCYRHCSGIRLPVLPYWESVTGPIWESLRSCSISAVR